MHHEPGFSDRTQVIACGNWCVPLLWMSLFQQGDLATGRLPSADGTRIAEVPMTHRRYARKRLATAVSVLHKTFPHIATWQLHADLLLAAVENAADKRPYLSIDWTQLDTLTSPREFAKASKWLMRYLSGQRVKLPAQQLAGYTDIAWKRSFPDPLSADLSVQDEKNLAALLGNDYERKVPWWPSASARGGRPKKSRSTEEGGRASGGKSTAAASARTTKAELHRRLMAAVHAESEGELRKLLRQVEDLSSPPFSESLDYATRHQRWNATSRIPNLLLAHGVKVSPQALADVIVKGTAAQLDAILQRGGINLSKRIKATGFSRPAPAVSWIVYDQDGNKATQKLKRLLAAGASVDVKSSGGEWMLIESVGEPWAKLLIPRASRKHRLAALKYVLEYRFPAEVEPSRVEAKVQSFVKFVRALHRSGLEEARGREAEIRAKQDPDARRSPLESYPYR